MKLRKGPDLTSSPKWWVMSRYMPRWGALLWWLPSWEHLVGGPRLSWRVLLTNRLGASFDGVISTPFWILWQGEMSIGRVYRCCVSHCICFSLSIADHNLRRLRLCSEGFCYCKQGLGCPSCQSFQSRFCCQLSVWWVSALYLISLRCCK